VIGFNLTLELINPDKQHCLTQWDKNSAILDNSFKRMIRTADSFWQHSAEENNQLIVFTPNRKLKLCR